MRYRAVTVAMAVCVFLSSVRIGSAQTTKVAPPDVVSSSVGEIRVQRLTTLEFPWGLAFLPDGRLLITEKPGRLRIWADGKLSEPVGGVPEVVYRATEFEQGGLMDVAVDPDFARNGLVYLSFSEAAEQQSEQVDQIDDARLNPLDMDDNVIRGGAVARGRLEGNQLHDVKVIW